MGNVKRIYILINWLGLSVCRTQVDLGFLLDGSGSVEMYGKGNFQRCLDFIKSVANAFVISPHDTRVGVIVFSDSSELIFGFDRYSNRNSLVAALDTIKLPAKTTFTGKGLKMARDQLFSGARHGVPHILIVLTDGRSHDDVVKPARALREAGVQIFTVGLGTNYDESQLKAIADDPYDYHALTVDFPEMTSIISTLQNMLCKGIFIWKYL